MQQAATRMPLGDLWRGVCRAKEKPHTPDDFTISELCNMGYAHGRCPLCPRTEAGDAVRFLVSRDQAELIRIEYVVERDHHPQTHGALEYRRASGALSGTGTNAVLERQALAFVTSYLHRRPAAA